MPGLAGRSGARLQSRGRLRAGNIACTAMVISAAMVIAAKAVEASVQTAVGIVGGAKGKEETPGSTAKQVAAAGHSTNTTAQPPFARHHASATLHLHRCRGSLNFVLSRRRAATRRDACQQDSAARPERRLSCPRRAILAAAHPRRYPLLLREQAGRPYANATACLRTLVLEPAMDKPIHPSQTLWRPHGKSVLPASAVSAPQEATPRRHARCSRNDFTWLRLEC